MPISSKATGAHASRQDYLQLVGASLALFPERQKRQDLPGSQGYLASIRAKRAVGLSGVSNAADLVGGHRRGRAWLHRKRASGRSKMILRECYVTSNSNPLQACVADFVPEVEQSRQRPWRRGPHDRAGARRQREAPNSAELQMPPAN